jgi:hypothetical protein
MNPGILSVISVRIGSVHIALPNLERTEFPSKNKAKAHSRKLGGAGRVRALRDTEAMKAFVKEYIEAESMR